MSSTRPPGDSGIPQHLPLSESPIPASTAKSTPSSPVTKEAKVAKEVFGQIQYPESSSTEFTASHTSPNNPTHTVAAPILSPTNALVLIDMDISLELNPLAFMQGFEEGKFTPINITLGSDKIQTITKVDILNGVKFNGFIDNENNGINVGHDKVEWVKSNIHVFDKLIDISKPIHIGSANKEAFDEFVDQASSLIVSQTIIKSQEKEAEPQAVSHKDDLQPMHQKEKIKPKDIHDNKEKKENKKASSELDQAIKEAKNQEEYNKSVREEQERNFQAEKKNTAIKIKNEQADKTSEDIQAKINKEGQR